jgi:hypothetical protein
LLHPGRPAESITLHSAPLPGGTITHASIVVVPELPCVQVAMPFCVVVAMDFGKLITPQFASSGVTVNGAVL